MAREGNLDGKERCTLEYRINGGGGENNRGGGGVGNGSI